MVNMEKLKIFLIGAIGYSIIEILWRGYTHWTMSLTGGICFLLIYMIFTKYNYMPIIAKCLLGTAVITTMELIVGCVVNLYLKWNVWDYSGYHYQLFGQICLFYSVMWFLLCIPLSYFIDFLSA